MKKIFNKLMSLLFAGIFMFSVLAGCNTSGGGDSSSTSTTPTTSTKTPQSETHYAKITERSDYIVKNGIAFYTIVIPEEAKEYEKKAATLLKEYYKNATGATLPVVTDDKATVNDRIISLGATKMFKESGIAVSSSKYGESGFRIVTKGDDVYIAGALCGEKRFGTYYGVQEFLYHTINYRAYMPTDIYYDCVDTIKMANFDVVEIPDFQYRQTGYRATTQGNYAGNAPDFNDLLRMSPGYHCLPYNYVQKLNAGHTFFMILPPEMYFEEHPDWYTYEISGPYTPENRSEFYGTAQLCFTNAEMRAELVRNVTQLFLDEPNADTIHIGQQDYRVFCHCENCDAFRNERTTNDAGILMWFINQIAREVTAVMKELAPTRKLQFRTFVYENTLEPPVHQENGEWVPDSEDVIPDENVRIQFTPLSGANGTQTVDSMHNVYVYRALLGWQAICKNIDTYFYCIDFDSFVVNTKMWDIFSEDLRLYKKLGLSSVFYQGPLYREVAQMWELRCWVMAKLLWDTSLSWKELAEEFISVYYGPVAETVQEYYDYLTTYYEKLRTVNNLTGPLFNAVNLLDPNVWPFGYVEGARMIFEKGYAAFEELKASEPKQYDYDRYYWRLSAVYHENIFMQLDFYMDNYSVEHRLEIYELFKAVNDKFGITTWNQGLLWTEYYDKWEGSIYVG